MGGRRSARNTKVVSGSIPAAGQGGWMVLRFTVLASGSGGNATLVEADGFGVLLDVGLGPRQLGARLAAVGSSWAAVHAVLLTHTHSDHWKDRSLAHLRRRRLPFYCHPDHHPSLLTWSPAFAGLLSHRVSVRNQHREERCDVMKNLFTND